MNFNQQPFQCGCKKNIHTQKVITFYIYIYKYVYPALLSEMDASRWTWTPRVITLNILPYFKSESADILSEFPPIFDETCQTCRRDFTRD